MGDNTVFGLGSSMLLDRIDKLFACNVGDLVDLPQLVVVGDQSSGKSSVLEGLTNLPFPRDAQLCTRFATQISFRRSPHESISASIKPADDRPESETSELRAWSKVGLKTLNRRSFSKIIKEAMSLMGISSGEDSTRKTFANDVLRLEIAGPQKEHFSVIDVPGIFRMTTKGKTTKEDRDMVDSMVRDYMENPRSVILAVIPCNVDIATQDILEKAEQIDPEGIRTFGILTKPDLVDKGGETAVIDIMEGREHPLQLGWHLLRNPGQSDLEIDSHERKKLEDTFFKDTAPWKSLDKESVGVEALLKRLREILEGHIRREFPSVKTELNHRLSKAMKQHQKLGPKRELEAQQREYLMNIAIEFQRAATQAVRTDYSHDDIFDSDQKLRLATEAVNRGSLFANDMEKYGHTYKFASGEIDSIQDDSKDANGLCRPAIIDAINDDDFTAVRTEEDHPGTVDIVYGNGLVRSPSDESILAWLKDIHKNSRGFELGTFDASLLHVALKEQAQKWHNLALGYVSDIVTLVHNFVMVVVESKSPSSRVRDGIMSLLGTQLQATYHKAMEHVQFLLTVELSGIPATYDHYFNDALENNRQKRLSKRLEKSSFNDANRRSLVLLQDIVRNHPQSNSDHTIFEIHDILNSYYTVARKRFVDNVRMHVADFHLITGPCTPLSLFSATFVAALSKEQLEDIAGEDFAVKRRRAALEKEISKLEEGKGILG